MWKIVRLFFWCFALTGVVYPLLVLALSHLFLYEQATGSLVVKKGKVVGSLLIGEKFEKDHYFWPRPSAVDYNPLASGGSNLGPTSALLKGQVEERKKRLQKGTKDPIPHELLFASASGLDPHLSLRAVHFQIPRVIKARGLEKKKKDLEDLVESCATVPFFGEPYVNILHLNILLERLWPKEEPSK